MRQVGSVLGCDKALKPWQERLAKLSPERLAELDAIHANADTRSPEQRFIDRARAAGMEGEMLNHTFESIPLPREQWDPTLVEAVRLANNYADAWPNVENQGLFLYGDPGRSKSCVLEAMLNKLLHRMDTRAMLIPCVDINRWLSRYDVDVILATYSLLILDDMEKGMDLPGSRYQSTGDKAIRQIINYAARTKRLVICATTNLPPKGKDSWQSISEPLASRLIGLGEWLEVKGSVDLREAGKQRPHWTYDSDDWDIYD